MARNAGYSYAEQVGPQSRGVTLVEHLARTHRHTSADEWRERIARGEVEVAGIRADAERLLSPGDRIVWNRPGWEEPEVPLSFELLLEDDEVVAVAKPSGLPTMPAGGFLEHTLLALVRARWPEATPLHRLGRDTSGLVLFARTDRARSLLNAAFRTHEMEKTYRALAAGRCLEEQLDITVPIGPVPHPLLGEVYAASPGGKPSRSVARVLERRPETTLFSVRIETGRPHQIRIHLASQGFPLAGDPLYGPGGIPLPGTRALPGDGGYLLHAERLAFRHPATGRVVELVAPPPAALRTAREGA